MAPCLTIVANLMVLAGLSAGGEVTIKAMIFSAANVLTVSNRDRHDDKMDVL
jgi:hypothetical protein